MSTQRISPPRRIRAALIGFGLDSSDGPHRIITGKDFLIRGGSAETQTEILETLLRLEDALDVEGQSLGNLAPDQLADVARRIDCPQLHEIALRLEAGLRERGRSFDESTPEELTELASGALDRFSA